MKRNNESDEKVIEFMSIASLEYDIALMLMKESGYDLDQAISNFFSSLSAHETNSNKTPTTNSNSHPKKKDFYDKNDDDYVPLESLPKPKVMRLVDNYYENEDYQPPSHVIFDQNPVEPFRNFKEEKLPDKPGKVKNLASLFRPPFEICFEDTYEKAMEHGSKHHKYLIINIQEITIFDCQRLNRDTWSDTTLKAYIKNNFVFWQRTRNMAVKFCQYYAPQELPHISILDPRTGEKLDTWEGFMKATDMLNNLKKFLRNHPFEPESIEITEGTPDPIKPKVVPVKKPVVKHISDLTEEEQMEEIIKISLLESQEQEDEENRKNNGKDSLIKDEANHLKRKETNPILIDDDDDSQPSRKKMKLIEIDQDNKNGTDGPIVIEDNNPIYEISEEDFITLSAGDDSYDNENMDEENAREDENKENEIVVVENKVEENKVEENKVEENKVEENKVEENIPVVDCTLKIRLPNGTFLSKVFTSICSLYKVYEWIKLSRTDIEDNKRRESCFNLLCGHPSKLYTEKDCRKVTLHHAGLVPRGVIFVENV
jgi:hypothetical protein